MQHIELGTLGIAKTKSGIEFVVMFRDLSIDYDWYPVLGMKEWRGEIVDPIVDVEIIGYATEESLKKDARW